MPYDVKGILCCKITKKKQYIIISTLKKVQKDFLKGMFLVQKMNIFMQYCMFFMRYFLYQ